ncbi:MAG: hypothetical protein IPP94_12075 [Ignavibacteria bacterium]|nr:hypothetical protein [Ignavibacteria bacterium]
MFLVLLSVLMLGVPEARGQRDGKAYTAGYLVAGPALSAEDNAALELFERRGVWRLKPILLDTMRAGLPKADVYWSHVPDSAALALWENNPRHLDLLREEYLSGKSFLFTDLAALFPHRMGRNRLRRKCRCGDQE